MIFPDWWQFTIMALAAWRVWHLLAYDTILDGPRNIIAGLPWNWTDEKAVPKSYRTTLAEFITCCYCLGAWTATAWWGVFQLSERWTLVVATPFALSAALILVHRVASTD